MESTVDMTPESKRTTLMTTRFGASQFLLSRSLNAILLAGLFAAGTIVSGQSAQTPAPAVKAPAHRSHYSPNPFPKRAVQFYQEVWGIDSITVRAAESGELIRFNYRVINATKAKQLNDKKAEPALIDPRAGVQLVVPSLEKVGQLRQSIPPENGKIYWMAFSNPRRTVKPGDHVNIVIGNFHADNLVVE